MAGRKHSGRSPKHYTDHFLPGFILTRLPLRSVFINSARPTATDLSSGALRATWRNSDLDTTIPSTEQGAPHCRNSELSAYGYTPSEGVPSQPSTAPLQGLR